MIFDFSSQQKALPADSSSGIRARLKSASGKTLGTVGAKPHIRPAELNAEKKLMKKVKVTVRGDNS